MYLNNLIIFLSLPNALSADRAERLKSAKVEAMAEIEALRAAKQHEYEEYEQSVLHFYILA